MSKSSPARKRVQTALLKEAQKSQQISLSEAKDVSSPTPKAEIMRICEKGLQNSIYNRTTLAAHHRILDELDYDPLAAAVDVAKGNALTKDHPFLKLLTDTLANWQRRIANNETILVEEVEELSELGIKMLTDSWVPHDMRIKTIMELISYLYPKRKAVDINKTSKKEVAVVVAPLSEQDLNSFKRKFNNEY